ncbi:MAG: ABC transporter permease [Calditrichia bacterium]|nr:ABC transporter permease [Calditrichia bacterium]
MSLFFHITEGIKGLTKARLATLLSISSIMLTIILMALFIIFSLNLNTWINSFREKIEMEVFLKITVSEEQIDELTEKLEQIPGILNTQFINKEEAAKRFKEEFGQDIFDVLNFNPLPLSFIITLEDRARNLNSIQKISGMIENITEVDEIVYQKFLLETIDKYINFIAIGVLFVGLIITVIAVVLIYNTIRLTIYARRDAIYIMRLVGATQAFIRTPFIIEGVLQGLIASSLASVIVYYLVQFVIHFIYPFLVFNNQIFIFLISFGLIIGLLSASLSVAKFLKSF